MSDAIEVHDAACRLTKFRENPKGTLQSFGYDPAKQTIKDDLDVVIEFARVATEPAKNGCKVINPEAVGDLLAACVRTKEILDAWGPERRGHTLELLHELLDAAIQKATNAP